MDSERTLGRGDVLVPDSWVSGATTTGASPPVLPPPHVRIRQLNRSEIRRLLRKAPKLTRDMLVKVIFDESWSVRGGNDVVGLRHELILIALEHLAAGIQAKGRWYAQISAFDTPSVFDLPITQLNRRGLEKVQDVLLRASPGGCSILGPSLRRAESSTTALVVTMGFWSC